MTDNMNQFIRLMIILITMTLPCPGYSGDDGRGAELPSTTSQLTTMLQALMLAASSSTGFLNLEELSAWSFNRDHCTSTNYGPDGQTVDGVLTVTARFQITVNEC